MRILFIHNRYKYYGGEDVAVDLENSLLIEYGHVTKVIIFDNADIKGAFSKLSLAAGSIYSSASAKRIQAEIKAFKPDVIHVHNLFYVASPAVLNAAKKAGIPVVMTLHNYRLVCANALLLRDNLVCEKCVKKTIPLAGIKHRCYRNSIVESTLVTAVTSVHKLTGTWKQKVDRYIALTEFARSKFLESSLKLLPQNISVKPNFILDPGNSIQPRSEHFLFVGRISPEKGVRVMLSSFISNPSLKLTIVGEGPESRELTNDFARYPNIYFAGTKSKPEVLELMKTSRALIFPSIWYEGLPFTILEAFATGTPVIASRLGSMINMITEEYNGVLFAAGDAKSLTTAIEKFQTLNPDTLSANARSTYMANYHPDRHYNSIMHIYHDICKQSMNK